MKKYISKKIMNQRKYHNKSRKYLEWNDCEILLSKLMRGFPGGAVVESLPANAGDTGSCPGLGGPHMPRSN